jgi:ATP-dependent Zn protease
MAAVQAGSLTPDQLVFPILEGAPGTGKTLVAEALARSAGWNFVSSSVGSLFTSGDGALGGVSKNLKDFIDRLLTGEPTVGFMDELDALPDRSTMDDRAREWWTTIVTLFFVQIDRLKKSGKPVILIGATNYFGRLDAALIRPGRLQQRVSVLPPESDEEILQLLRHFLKADLADAELEKLIRLAYRATPAQVEGWTKQARGTARAQHRPLELADIIAQMAPIDTRSLQDLRTVALHEIGHAVVGIRLGMTVESVSVIPEGGAGGHTLTKRITTVPTLPQLDDMVTLTLGGRAADLIVGEGANAGAEADLAEATEWLLRAHETFGLRDTLASRQAIRSTARAQALLDAVEADLQRALARAMGIITADREVVLKLAARLTQEKVMTGTDIAVALAVALPARGLLAPSPQPAIPPPQDDPADQARGMLPYGH